MGSVKATAKDSSFQRRNRQSIRLQGYDYSRVGAYFITICTRDRECWFGKVVDGQMQLNETGQIVQLVWNDLPQFYEEIELDAFIVMPNHVHGLVVIRPGGGAIHELPLLQSMRELSATKGNTDRRHMLLSKVVGRFKMVSAKQINILNAREGNSVWQRNYYEHVIRDDGSLNRVRQYISDNPAQWEFDHENPAVGKSERRGDS